MLIRLHRKRDEEKRERQDEWTQTGRQPRGRRTSADAHDYRQLLTDPHATQLPLPPMAEPAITVTYLKDLDVMLKNGWKHA
jgi:hypothetical protein